MNEKPRILLVDDDESTRQMLTLILGKRGYEIETAATGEDALARVRERAFNLVFLDVRLPDMDGVDLIAPLREIRPLMTVVVVTGYASVDTAVQALNEGASGYITKPVDIDELLATVREALEKQRLAEDRQRAMEALRDSEDKHRTLVEQSLQGVAVVQDFRIVFANTAFADIAGYSVEELQALSPEGVKALVHPEDQGFVWARFRERLAGRPVPARYAYRTIRKDGAVRWLDMFASRIEYEGNPAVQAAIMDITDRRQAEKALRESEARNRALLNAVPDLMFVQRRDGTYLDCHATKTDTLLMRPEQFLGKRMQDLFPEDLATTILRLIEQSIATGTMQVHEYQLPIAGQPRWFELRIVPYGADRVLSIIRETTERRQAERATRERQRYLEGVLSAAPDAIVTLDSQNRIVDWNAGAEQLFGYERQEVIGRTLDPLVARGEALEEACRFTRLVSGAGTLPPTETVRYRRDGSPVDLIVAGAPIVVDDELVGVVAVYTDITERKRAEETLARRHRELTSLYQTVTAISSNLSLEAVLQAIAAEMVRALGSGGCAVSLWNRDENQVETLIDYSLHRPHDTEPAGTIHDLNDYPATLRVLETGQALLVQRDDATADEAELAMMEETETFTLLMLPLVARDQVLGLVELYDDVEARIYTPEDIRLGESLTTQAAIAIENARLYKETQQLAAFNEGIVQGMAEGILMEDAEGHITFANTMAAELLGYAPAELLGMHWRAVVPAEHLDEVGRESARRPEGVAGRYETALLRRDGGEVPVLVSARPIFDDGRFSGVLSVFTDITERKQAEQALRRYAKRLETLHEVDRAVLAARSPQETAEVSLDRVWQLVPCTGAGIVLLDFEAGEAVLFAVRADLPVGPGPGTRWSLGELVDVERLRQGEVMAEEDLLGHDPLTLSHAPAALQALASAGLRAYVAAPLIAQNGLIGVLGLGSTSPGDFSPEHVDIVREVANQLAVALHQGRLRAELETERRRLETTVEHVPEGILLLDAERRILVANPAARDHLPMLTDASVGDVPARLADRPLEDLLAPPPEGLWHDLQIPGPPPRIFEVLARSVAGNEPEPEGWVL
ncbi:MAG: PAS domain S-box protein, partial [Anaerolineae bacterium]